MVEYAFQVGMVLLVMVPILLCLSVPISISVGLASAMAVISIPLLTTEQAITTSVQRVFTGINSFALLAIPFFVLAGNIMNNGGIAKRLVNCAKALSGSLPGALAHTNIVANMMFGAISGSGVAAAAAIGGTMGPMQKEEGYDPAFSATVNIASAPSGMLIPPSNTLIVYSLVSGGTSVAALFIAGYLPGILWGLGCMIVAFIYAKKRGYRSERTSGKQILLTFLDAIPSLILIVLVIGGIILGWFTATEGSCIAVVYSLLLSFVYRSIKIRDLPEIILESAKTTCIVVFMIGTSSIMSWVMAYTGIPTLIANSLLSVTGSIMTILLMMNIILLVVGTFMDPTPAILIFAPIFLPIVLEFGVHPVHFGIIMVFNLCIGTITPPVGPILFTGCRIAGLRIEDVFKQLLPFFAVSIGLLMLVTFFPVFSMLIPQAFGLV